MPLYLTGEAEVNFPKPLHELAAETVLALFDGRHAVRTSAVANALNRHNAESLLFHLRKAERLGLVARGVGDSWIPL